MRTVRTVRELRASVAPARRAGRMIGLVPTMGALHEGHLSLLRRARAECDVVVASLFVNPAQFNEHSDLAAYPRDQAKDEQMAAGAGVDYLFAPSAEEVYPPGFATTVTVGGLGERLEGQHRGSAHFTGVSTVVAKLLNMAAPDVAYFGQKDAQQALVVRRLVSDLNFPTRIEVCPTVREADGLALSSRNRLLSPRDRERASALYRALRLAAGRIEAGERDAQIVAAAARAEVASSPGVELEYLELVDPESFAPVRRVDRDVVAVVAARVGAVRLIDNQPILAPPKPAEGPGPSRGKARAERTEEALQCSAR